MACKLHVRPTMPRVHAGASEKTMIYQTYQNHADWLRAWRLAGSAMTALFNDARFRFKEHKSVREVVAAWEVFSAAELTHVRPDYGVTRVTVNGVEEAVAEESALRTPFCTLLRFRKASSAMQPRVLVVAPMSGHFATLLRDTVRTLAADHDVYITDWHNARDVPLLAGRFGLDEYIEHVMMFLRHLGEGAHVVAVCQPCVPALAATALMAEDGDPATPASLTLMAGPIDCRIAPTQVNDLATSKPIEWFERTLIATVPWQHPGAWRRVYPGFMQLMAFMSMNPERHRDAFRGMYDALVKGDSEKAEATRSFYREYLAVADLPADFYLETVKQVFQDYSLARGVLRWRDRTVDPAAIRRTSLLTVEGERDDICSLGQTLAAHDLCTGLRQYRKAHYVQPGVGHYGVFSGRRWSHQIYPIVRDVIHTSG